MPAILMWLFLALGWDSLFEGGAFTVQRLLPENNPVAAQAFITLMQPGFEEDVQKCLKV